MRSLTTPRSTPSPAIRLYEAASRGRNLTKKDLVTLEAEDILKSHVFEGGAYSNPG